MTDLADLIKRVETATGPDRELDADIVEALLIWPVGYGRRPWKDQDGRTEPRWLSGNGLMWWAPPAFTASLDSALALVEEKLPGWWWKVGTCSVSDDACVCPDFNDPVHGERLRARYFPIEHNGPYDGGFDIDRRPPGNPALAVLEALLHALAAEPDSDSSPPPPPKDGG